MHLCQVRALKLVLPAETNMTRSAGTALQSYESHLQEDSRARLRVLLARKIPALLGFRYRQLPDGSFEHSQVITLIDGQGRVLANTTKLIGDSAFQGQLQAAAAPGAR
jgi:protein SCO1/2